jgi:hypothetical protein
MKYYFEARSIPSVACTIASKHNQFLEGTRDLRSPWGSTGNVPAPDIGAGLSTGVSARKLLGRGLSGDINYHYRGDLRDHASSDDFFYFVFNPEKIDFAYLVDVVFLQYVKAFDPYYAAITDQEFVHLDFEDNASLSPNARNSLFRLGAVTYMKDDFCRRAWGMSAPELVQKLQGGVEHVCEAADGVFLVLTSKVLPLEELKALTASARDLILN